MNILILTGKFGMGHLSAADSLKQELLRGFPSARVEIVDFFAYALPDAGEAIYKWFNLMVTHGSGLYNALYRLKENDPQSAFPLYAFPFVQKMETLLAEQAPTAVIATHPLCAKVMSRCKEETGLTIPLVTCVTDVTAHSEWLSDECDAYLVGTPELKDAFAAKGVEREKLLVTGIPVKAEFKLPPRREESDCRRLLIMGGGLGLVPAQKRFYERLNGLTNVKTTLICGRNEDLYRATKDRYENIEVVGFTDRVYDYMAASHLMLSKPGGITLFEAIFSQLPILAWEPFLEQERHNARFLVKQGIGQVAKAKTDACLAAIEGLIYDTAALEQMSGNMRALQDRLAKEGLEQLMERFCPAGT